VPARVGLSVKKVLCEQWGISPEYLDKRVKTIFLNGNAVDDIDKAILQDGSTLALSAAMPGLAGPLCGAEEYWLRCEVRLPIKKRKRRHKRKKA